MSKEKIENKAQEKLTEVEILKLNNVLLKIENINLQLNGAQQFRETLITEIVRDHGFSDGAKINLDGANSTIEGKKRMLESENKEE